MLFKQNASRIQLPVTELQELCEWEQYYLQKERYISRAFSNYDVVFHTFRDIKDYLKNMSTSNEVSIANISMSIKYENLICRSSGGILLYFLIAQIVFTKILLFCKWKLKRKR